MAFKAVPFCAADVTAVMPKAKELQVSLKPRQVVISTKDITKYSLLSDRL